MAKKDLRDKVLCYQQFFDTEEGKVVLYDLMDHTNFLSNLKKKGCDDTDIFINEGMREVMVYILAQLNTDIELLDKLIKDKAQEEKDDVPINFNNHYGDAENS